VTLGGAAARRRMGVGSLVAAVLFIDSVFYAAIVPIIGRLSDELDLSTTQAGVLVGAYAAGMVMAAYPVARIVVRWKARVAVAVGLAGMAGACLVFALARSFEALLAARALQGVGGALSWTGGLAWLAESTSSDRRGRMLGTALGAGVFGAQLGPAMGAFSAAVGRGPASSIGALAGGLLVVWTLATRTSEVEEPTRTAPARALLGRELGAGMWLIAVPSAGIGLLDVLAPLGLADLDKTPLQIGSIFFVAAGVLAVVSRITGQAIDQAGIGRPTRIALTSSIAVLALLSVATSTLVLALGIIVASAALGALWGPGMYLLSSAAEKAGVDHGYAFGAFLFAWAVGFAAGSSSSGVLAGLLGTTATYLLMALLCLTTAAPSAVRAHNRQLTRTSP
jgi:predicted MFS family arabinose efflux permease